MEILFSLISSMWKFQILQWPMEKVKLDESITYFFVKKCPSIITGDSQVALCCFTGLEVDSN